MPNATTNPPHAASDFIPATNVAPPRLVRIEAYYPAEEATGDAAYLAGFVACEDCDGKGYWLGEAHLTSEHFVRCGECRNGDVGIELEGDKAEDAYEAWAASDTDRYEIEAGSPGGAYASASAVGWAAFLPVAAAFSAKHPHTVVNNVDRADVGTNGIDDWQAEMIQVAAMRLEFTAEKTEVAA